MRIRKEKKGPSADVRGVAGLPVIRYHLPLVVTTLSALILSALSTFLAIITIITIVNQLSLPGGPQDGVFLACVCAPLGIIFVGATGFFSLAVVRGIRDLFAPVHYTRGTVADRPVANGRRGGTWLHVDARYAGPSLAVASEVTPDQRAASPDRSQILQPRFTADSVIAGKKGKTGRPQSSYLPADRLSADLEAIETRKSGTFVPPLVFRLDPASRPPTIPGEEVLIAHSPFLQHVYYVAQLRDGEWESFQNKLLI